MTAKKSKGPAAPSRPGKKKLSTRIIEWIESKLFIPEGRFVGKPVKLKPFQKKIIRGIYDTASRTVIVSMARKNAKTALAAMLTIVHLVGPMAQPNSQLYSSALTREQAAITFNLAAKMVLMNAQLRDWIIIRKSAKELECPERGTVYKALSADAGANLGKSPIFVIHDELGAVRGPESDLFDAIESGMMAHEAPLSIIISTQAPRDGDLLSILIDEAETGIDPKTKLFLWTTPMEMEDPFSEDAIRLSNPAYDHFQNQEELLSRADKASRMPSREASFRNLNLNQRVEAGNPFVTASVWKRNGVPPGPLHDVYVGLDLSSVKDLTACVLVSPDGEDKLDVEPHFWLPALGLKDRAKEDREPYDTWHDQGHLHTTPGASVDYEDVAGFLAGLFREYNIIKVGFDAWSWEHFRPWLLKEGMSEAFVDARFEPMRQGNKSMTPALRVLETQLLNDQLRHGMHPVLTMCSKNAVVKADENNNRILDKKRSTGRIDGMVALAMASFLASKDMNKKPVFKKVNQIFQEIAV